MIRGRGIPQKYILDFDTNTNSSNYDDDEEKESKSNKRIYYNWTQMKLFWRTVVMIRGRGIPQKFILDFDTNTNSLNYDDDEEKESKSNKRIY